MVIPLSVVAQESRHLKSLPVEKSPFDSNIIAITKCAKMIQIKSLSGGRKGHDDPLSGLIADGKGSSLNIQLLHLSIQRLDPGLRSVITAPTLIPILDGFLNPDQIRIGIAARILL